MFGFPKTPEKGGVPSQSGTESEDNTSLPGTSAARKLLPSPLSRFDSTEAEKTKKSSVYLHTTRILKQAVPNEDELIDSAILELFLANQISNDLSFSLLSVTDFPPQD